MLDENTNHNLGRIIKQRRVMLPLTLRGLASLSGISSSHLGRIERGDRYPSATVLRKLAQPLGFTEGELFSLAGYLSPTSVDLEKSDTSYGNGHLDPQIKMILSYEPVEVQQAVIGILAVLKSVARSMIGE